MAITLTIAKDMYGEYRVPGPNKSKEEAGSYYTDDKQDAKDTARLIYKREGIEIGSFRIRPVESHEKDLQLY